MLAQHRAYQEYTQGVESRKRALRARPERAGYYELARFCLAYGQYAAARSALETAAQRFGEDAGSRALRAQIEATRARAALP
jgi:thioredoxin-like negative regulator of GroEL